MGTYYRETWFKMSLKMRVQLAKLKCIVAKTLLEEARARLRNSEELLATANSYRPLHGRSGGISFIDEFSKKP